MKATLTVNGKRMFEGQIDHEEWSRLIDFLNGIRNPLTALDQHLVLTVVVSGTFTKTYRRSYADVATVCAEVRAFMRPLPQLYPVYINQAQHIKDLSRPRPPLPSITLACHGSVHHEQMTEEMSQQGMAWEGLMKEFYPKQPPLCRRRQICQGSAAHHERTTEGMSQPLMAWEVMMYLPYC